jgi:hypothetical protein
MPAIFIKLTIAKQVKIPIKWRVYIKIIYTFFVNFAAMRFLKLALLGICSLLFSGTTSRVEPVSCREILNRMLDSIRVIKTQRYHLKSTERVDGHLFFAESTVKINERPKKIYFKSLEKNVEVLWVEGENKGNAIVHSRSLPFMNMDLDPYGAIMRKNQHHTIFDLGFPYIGKTLATTILKTNKDFDKHFSYAGTVNWNRSECFQLLISYPEYKWIEHITKKGETVNAIAALYNTSDFKIRYRNDLSSYFGAIKEGKKIMVPIPYSNRAIVFIDKRNYLPVNLKVYDEEGLFEAYEFYNVRINKPFAADEFSKDFKDYDF